MSLLSDYHQPLFRPRDRRIQPLPPVFKAARFIDDDNKVVLRPLRLVAGDGIGKFKAAYGILAAHLEAAEHLTVALVHEDTVGEQTSLVAIAVKA